MNSIIRWISTAICSLYTIVITWFLTFCFEVPNTFCGFISFMYPAIMMLSIVVISYWFPAYGMLMCPACGIALIAIVNGEGNVLYYSVIVFPMFLAGMLYFINQVLKYGDETKTYTQTS